MDIGKIVRLIAVVVALVAGLYAFPQAAVVVAILGLVGGWFVEDENFERFLIGAIALSICHGALGVIPAIGGYLSGMLGSLSSLFLAAACTVIVKGIYNRLKP